MVSQVTFGQVITGKITNIFNEPIDQVMVLWKNESDGILSNEKGEFIIEKTNDSCSILVFKRVGFKTDELTVGERKYWSIQLFEDASLSEVTVTAKSSASRFTNDVAKVEALGVREIQRAACCSLAGCFRSNSNVDANTTNVVTDAKELRILGLAGVYNQILIEGHPLVQGIALPYGPGSYPGTMIEKIFITKGTNSVLQGFESISGQIGIDFHNADIAPKYFFNAFANSFGESQYNVNHMQKGRVTSNLTTLHYTSPATDIDRDKDGFRDIVKTKRFSAFNRWSYDNPEKPFIRTRIGVRYLNEQREGGLTTYDFPRDKASSEIYGQHVAINHGEAYTSNNFILNEKTSLILLSGAFLQNQQAYFGLKSYNANQFNATSSLYIDYYYGASNNNLKFGLSHRHNKLKEDIKFVKPISFLNYEGTYNTNYDISGVFAENKITIGIFTFLSGIRFDYHGSYGWKFTPRLLVRANVAEKDDIRFSIGKGFRRAHIFAENQYLLASNRDLDINQNLSPEEALNIGLNYLKYLKINETRWTISADLYHTYFFNQIFPDYNSIGNKALIDNNANTSISNSFSLENKFEFSQQFDIKVAYNFLDVYREKENIKEYLPFVSKHKITANTSYSVPKDDWQFDLTYRWFGSRTLPSTTEYPLEFKLPSNSPSYGMIDLQITRRWKALQIYGGIENITDFRQAFPILGSNKPFGEYFDPSFNWGPTKGREFFFGVRYKIEQDN